MVLRLSLFSFLYIYIFFLIYLFILFIYFWLRWVFVAARGLSLVVVSGGYSSLQCAGFSLWWLLLLRSTGSRHAGFIALRHVGTSQTRARTRVPCIGRQILNHYATREAPLFYIFILDSLFKLFRIRLLCIKISYLDQEWLRFHRKILVDFPLHC